MANCYNDCIHCFVCQYVNHDEYPTVQQLKDDCRYCFTSADVAPKSEVAREIFEDIYKTMNSTYSSVQKICFYQMETGNTDSVYCTMMLGKLEGVRELGDKVAELKKKYTEGET